MYTTLESLHKSSTAFNSPDDLSLVASRKASLSEGTDQSDFDSFERESCAKDRERERDALKLLNEKINRFDVDANTQLIALRTGTKDMIETVCTSALCSLLLHWYYGSYALLMRL